MKGGAGGGVNLIRELRDVFTRIVVYIRVTPSCAIYLFMYHPMYFEDRYEL